MELQMQYKAGQAQTFIATRSFALGSSGVTVPEGSEVEFDGTQVSYAGLAPVVMPQIRGAIRSGWLVPSANYDPGAPMDRPVSAGMTMRKADGGDPLNPDRGSEVTMTVDEEEREVGSVQAHAESTRDLNRTNYRRDRTRTPRSESTAGQRYHGVSVEPQDGVPVPGIRLKTPAGERAKRSYTDVWAQGGRALSEANKIKIQPGQGRSREQLIQDAITRGGLTDEELAEYEEELAACRAARGVFEEGSARVVGHVRSPGTQQKEGFNITGSVGGGTAIADMGGTGGQGETEVVEEEGIKFTRTKSPKRGVRLVDKKSASPDPVSSEESSSAPDDVCRKIAKAVCPDFPENYVFTDPIRKKIARLQADYDDRPDIIRAVAAAETDGAVKQRLIEEFPEAFS